MVLDFDNGTLSPNDFIRLFWTEAGSAGKRSFIICNTFSRSPAEPNRFRVILLYRRPATSIEQHQAVFDAVVSRLEKHGYTKETAGLDGTSRSGIHSYYMPGTNREHPDSAFFETRGTETTEIARYGIDPEQYWKTSKPTPTVTEGIGREVGTTPDDIHELGATIKTMKEGRHKLFFELARKLASHYRDRGSVERHLATVAGNDNKLQKKARDAVESLCKYGRL